MKGRQRFLYEAAEDGGGGGGGGWAPTEEWGSRIDSFIETAGPTLSALGEILSEPYEGAGGQAPDPMEQWQRDYSAWQEANGLGQGGQQAQPPVLDPQAIELAVQRAVEERMSPFAPLLGTIAEREGEQIARTQLAELKNEIGSFSDDQAIKLAQLYLSNGLPAEDALRKAAEDTFQYEQTIRQSAVDEFRQSLAAAAGAQGDLGAGAAVEGEQTPAGRNRYEDALSRFASRMSPVGPADL